MPKMTLRNSWPYWRTLLFFAIAVMNTILIAPENVGTWRHYLGYFFWLLATIDTARLVLNWKRQAEHNTSHKKAGP